jgi:DNA-binding NtrC family response regulator
MRLRQPELEASASSVIERADWPGNIPQMRSVLCATLAARGNRGPISGEEIKAQLDRLAAGAEVSGANGDAGFAPWIDGALAAGSFSMSELESRIYRAAVTRTDGNLSAAARLVGLTRAQLAYRLGTHISGQNTP